MDWGLGHATRCIPVVRYILAKGHTVILATSGPAASLLQANFPELEILTLPGYEVTYSRTGRAFAGKILSQVPRIRSAIRREQTWLADMHARKRFDLVISDNRYGLQIPGLRSVIMTHQLRIMTGFGAMADAVMQRMHYALLEKFDECWVIDRSAGNALGGTLSHPRRLPRNARYIGTLSQFQPRSNASTFGGDEILLLLSGPEPMRTILEERLIVQAAAIPARRFRIVAGNPSGTSPANLPAHITYHTHMNADALASALAKAQLVVCRSGYSTLMDLDVLGKKALLIPTPGQPEQEYLASYLSQSGSFLTRRQEDVNLADDIPAALATPGFPGRDASGYLQEMQLVIDDTLDRLDG